MSIIATVLAVVAMAGAPQGVTAHCATASLPGGAYGLTYSPVAAPIRIELAPYICAGIRDAASARAHPLRAWRNAALDRAGIALHVVVHEAVHATGIDNEYQTETKANTIAPRVIAHFFRGRALTIALACSRAYHDTMPLAYLRDLQQEPGVSNVSIGLLRAGRPSSSGTALDSPIAGCSRQTSFRRALIGSCGEAITAGTS